jgi:hypothetical protein
LRTTALVAWQAERPMETEIIMTEEKPGRELLKQLMAENPKASERKLIKLFRDEIWGEEEKYVDEMVKSVIENKDDFLDFLDDRAAWDKKWAKKAG